MGAIKDSYGIDPFSALTLSLRAIHLAEGIVSRDIRLFGVKLITNKIKFILYIML